jgi:uncharacterized membrane protein YraQ (UPF0718 family)
MNILQKLAWDFWSTMTQMSPYLLFGFLVAGLLSIFVSARWVERHLGGRGIVPILKASLFGVPLPLCSCGVIPVSMSLHKHGASKGATVAFLLATPQTGVDNILVTYSLLGPIFAVVTPIATFLSGVVGGILVDLFGDNRTAPPEQKEPCDGSCCQVTPSFGRKFLNGMRYAFIVLPRDIGKSMLVGLVIAAIITAFVPAGFFAEKLGSGIGAMLLMMVIGIPVYVCATASIPVAAAMILKGLSPGAALVFLMTGPATNMAGLTTIWRTLGPRTALLYLLAIAGSALTFGLILDAFAVQVTVAVAEHHHEMGPSLFGHLSAVALLLILFYGIIKPKKHHAPPASPHPNSHEPQRTTVKL